MKTPLVITFCLTLLAVLGLAAFLVETGHDITPLLIVLGAAVPSLGAVVLSQKAVTQTNGNLSAERTRANLAQAENAQLRSLLPPAAAASVPVAVVVAPNDPNTTPPTLPTVPTVPTP